MPPNMLMSPHQHITPPTFQSAVMIVPYIEHIDSKMYHYTSFCAHVPLKVLTCTMWGPNSVCHKFILLHYTCNLHQFSENPQFSFSLARSNAKAADRIMSHYCRSYNCDIQIYKHLFEMQPYTSAIVILYSLLITQDRL